MKRFALPILLTLTLLLSACSAASTSEQTPPEPAPVSPTETASVPSPASDANTSNELTRSDQQGEIIVDVTPLDLGTSSDQLEFDVALTTHSVDLSMDLATLATLTTDTGVTIQSTLWDAPRGGHHVEGKLIFPAVKDGKPILEGVKKITLTIVNMDVPSRVFEWDLK